MRNIESWSYPETLDRDDWLIATYYVELGSDASIVDSAHSMVISQTTGSWVSLPEELMNLVEASSARYDGLYRIPPLELRSDTSQPVACIIRIAYPVHIFNNDLSLLLTILLGNEATPSQKVKLLDFQLPPKFLSEFSGPRFGVQGIRDLLGVYDRPLMLSVIKPCIGLPPETGARIVYESALGGVDIVKDDEKFSDLVVSPLDKRVRAYKAAIQRAEEETGKKTLYIANISSQITKLRDNALRARDAGADAILINFLSVGLTAVQMIAQDDEINLPILTHFNLSQFWYESPHVGISSFLIVGKLPRLAGGDMGVQLIPYGNYTISPDAYKMYTRAMTMPLPGIRPSLPVVGGGAHPRTVPQLVADLGIDFAAGVGGAIQAHPQGAIAGARAMLQALEATSNHISLEDYAADHVELRQALEKW
jgi:2,3-diketo-5-methylthiopentyl-1-phosphate enolase